MAPYFWKKNQEKKSVGRRRRSSNQVGNARSQNPRLKATRIDNSNAGVQSPFKRKFVGKTSGQSSGNVSLRIHQHAEGSSSNPITLDDSENGSDNSGYLTNSNQETDGRNNTRNVRLRSSSSGRPSLPLKIGSTGDAFTSYDVGDSDSDSDYNSDSKEGSLLRAPRSMYLKAHRGSELSWPIGHPAAHVVPPQSAQLVGFSRGASSRSANLSSVIVSEQGGSQFAEAARRISRELLERHERTQQVTQMSRTGHLSIFAGSGNGPTTARVSFPGLDSETNADANPPVSRPWGTGHSIPSGWSTAEVTRGSAVVVGAGRIVHSCTINNQPLSLSGADPWPMPLFGINGLGSNHPSPNNNQRLPMGGAGPSRRPTFVYGINDRAIDRASNSNNQPLPVPLAALSRLPIPISALNGQVSLLGNHSNQASTEDTWPMPMPEDAWPMPVPMTAAAFSSHFVSGQNGGQHTRGRGAEEGQRGGGRRGRGSSLQSPAARNSENISSHFVSGQNGGQQTRIRGAVSGQGRGGRRGRGSYLQSPAAARNSQNMFELERALESMPRSGPMRADGPMVFGYSSGEEVEEAVEAEDALSDMRLDIDGMSYEELLDLEEQIGNVNTGITEKVAKKRLKLCKFVQRKKEIEPCCICQDEYKKGDALCSLKSCGHTFHPDCIKQWLMVKDACPICKIATDPSN